MTREGYRTSAYLTPHYTGQRWYVGLSYNMRRGRKDRILLSTGICPHLKSRLVREKLLSRRPIVEIIESALLAYLPADNNKPIQTAPRQSIDYSTWIDYK